MVGIADIKELIQHPEYVCFIERLQKDGKLSVCENLPSLAMLNSSAEVINKSKVSVKELLNLMSTKNGHLSRYVLAYVDKVSKDDDLEEEFPDGEEQDQYEGTDDRVFLPYDRDFVIFPVVLFYVIKNQPNQVLSFLKALGWPHVKANTEKELLFYKKVLRQEKH